MNPFKKSGPNLSSSVVTAVLALTVATAWVTAQVTDLKGGGRGSQNPPQSQEVGEDNEVGGERLRLITPDPVKYPVPRTAWDGKPDFSGVYFWHTYMPDGRETRRKALDLFHDVLLTPAAKAMRDKLNPEETPALWCWPESPLSGGMRPSQNNGLASVPGFFIVINEYDGNYRIIPTDGRPHDPSLPPTYGGDSVGHWEGDTLVVDVTNFKTRDRIAHLYMDTTSDALHIVERWTMPDARMFEYEAVIDDPKTLSRPWNTPRIRKGRMDYDLPVENFCTFSDEFVQIRQDQIEYSAGEQPKGPRLRLDPSRR